MYTSTTALLSAAFALVSTSSAAEEAQYPTSNEYGFDIKEFKTNCDAERCSYYCTIDSGKRLRIPAVTSSSCHGNVGDSQFKKCEIDSESNDLSVKIVKKDEGKFQVLVQYDFIDKYVC